MVPKLSHSVCMHACVCVYVCMCACVCGHVCEWGRLCYISTWFWILDVIRGADVLLHTTHDTLGLCPVWPFTPMQVAWYKCPQLQKRAQRETHSILGQDGGTSTGHLCHICYWVQIIKSSIVASKHCIYRYSTWLGFSKVLPEHHDIILGAVSEGLGVSGTDEAALCVGWDPSLDQSTQMRHGATDIMNQNMVSSLEQSLYIEPREHLTRNWLNTSICYLQPVVLKVSKSIH